MKESEINRMPTSFTPDDFSHCANCMQFVDFFLDKYIDGMAIPLFYNDILYLRGLLRREHSIMRKVIEDLEGDDDVV
jgi:hypothetical protein